MVKNIFVVLFSLVIAYSFYLTFMPNYNYHMFKNEMKASMEIVTQNDKPKDVMKRIMRLVDEYDIPVSDEDVELELATEKYTARISWEDTVQYFPFYPLYQKTYTFHIDTSK
ncbi:MAG: hypothetical protein Q7U10_02620 [Thermodesulfovibrionia bacterium]|nr:hypothetical protein [Thermodesulfovibrionia bacterium]